MQDLKYGNDYEMGDEGMVAMVLEGQNSKPTARF